MAVKMRLKRLGYKKHPIYRVVVADARTQRDGGVIDQIGTYDPNQEPSVISIDAELAKKWLNNGAQPTETVAKLLKQAGVEK
ncbi:MAG: 30S ribosomal protein S16 [Eubacterium sp.]|nr:30S ribosomal protein S16 [Eubacterium sp.]